MSKSALVFGRTGSPFTKRLIDRTTEHFDDLDVVAYLLGRRTADMESFVRDSDLDAVLWDHDLDRRRPSGVDPADLRAFENRHGDACLRRAIGVDRKLSRNGLAQVLNDTTAPYDDDELRGHASVRMRPLERLFESRSFAFVFGQQISYLGGFLCVVLAESYDVPFFRLGHTRVSDRFTLHNGEFEYSQALWNEFDRARDEGDAYPTAEEATAVIERVRNGAKLYSVPEPVGRTPYERSPIERVRYVASLIAAERGGIRTDYYAETPKVEYLSGLVRKRLNQWRLSATDTFDAFDPDDRYVYFPLQVQPELSLMIWARYHTDLDRTATHLSRSLPVDTSLYVNDHPNNWGVRPLSYYRRLQAEPNLRVLDRSVSTPDIVDGADAVACVTATVGLEALIKGTPVVTFGEERKAPCYANLDTVRTVSFDDDLSGAVAAAMADDVDHAEVRAYVAAALHHGIPRDHPRFVKRVCEYIERSVD